MNEEKICVKTKNLISKLNGKNKALLNELQIQHDNSKYKEKLQSQLNLLDYEDDEISEDERSVDELLNELVDDNYLLKLLNQRVEEEDRDILDKIKIFGKIRFTRQKMLLLKEAISTRKTDALSHYQISSCMELTETNGKFLTLRVIGCRNVKSADSLSQKAILSGLPISIRSKLKEEIRRKSIKSSVYPKIQCQIYSRSDELLYATQPALMSHHCWNESFSLPLPLKTPLKLFVVWISPYATMMNIISHYPQPCHQLHFSIAAMKYLYPSFSESQNFESILLKLFPVGELYLETFHKPVKKPLKNFRATFNKIQYSDLNLISVLGRGFFGKVFLCKVKTSGRILALKTIKKDYVVEKSEFDQLTTEKAILQLSTLYRHPLIVELIACLQNKSHVMFLMGFVEAGDIATLLNHHQQLTIEQTRFYAASIVLCLEFLHKNHIIYRDIKTENIMLDRYGYIKLVDFGLSKLSMTPTSLTSTLCGTLDYMAPEMFSTTSGYGFPVDWWALGVLTYVMCIGQVPFNCDTDDATIADIVDIHKPIYVPHRISRKNVVLSSFILSLMNRNSKSRLGSKKSADEVKSHPFFRNSKINFEAIYNREFPAPFIPNINNTGDLTYFDTQFTNEKPGFNVLEISNKCKYDPKTIAYFNNFCT